jgi:spore coat polysaccharide biosynthesis protein SpsF (cytidylyltransferase family)
LISPKIIDEAIFQFKSSGLEFIYNSDSDGGDGFDVEVFKLETLIRYGKDKEHVTGNMRLYANKMRIPSPKREGKSIDTMEDYLDVCEILK